MFQSKFTICFLNESMMWLTYSNYCCLDVECVKWTYWVAIKCNNVFFKNIETVSKLTLSTCNCSTSISYEQKLYIKITYILYHINETILVLLIFTFECCWISIFIFEMQTIKTMRKECRYFILQLIFAWFSC